MARYCSLRMALMSYQNRKLTKRIRQLSICQNPYVKRSIWHLTPSPPPSRGWGSLLSKPRSWKKTKNGWKKLKNIVRSCAYYLHKACIVPFTPRWIIRLAWSHNDVIACCLPAGIEMLTEYLIYKIGLVNAALLGCSLYLDLVVICNVDGLIGFRKSPRAC